MVEAWIEELSHDDCFSLLRGCEVGRIAFVVDDFPVVLPLNHRVVDRGDVPWVAVRTRPGNTIDRAPVNVAFQVDGIDASRRQGWTVLVRGKLHHVDVVSEQDRDRLDSEPWLTSERDSWILIEPFVVTGRRLHAAPVEWAFQASAYL